MGARALVVSCWFLLALQVVTEQHCRIPAAHAPSLNSNLKLRLEDCSSPTRSVTPSHEGWNGGGQPWAAPGDSPQMPTSPVSEFDSDAMKIDSPYMIDALAMLEDWQLPPAEHSAQQDSSWQPPSSYADGAASVASSQEDFSSSTENSGGRRRCQVCTLVDATRGVADSGDGGEWELLLCRHCAQFMNNTVTLSTRCEQCRRYATFGPYGGNRRSARHCKRHQLPGEVNVARKRCEYVHRNGMPCAQPPLFGDESSGAAKFCAWHRQHHHTNLVEGRVAAQLGRTCIEPGCEHAASFGELGVGAIVCSTHRAPTHVDMIHSRRCESPDCQRHPSYGTRSGGVARFCKAHKPWNFVDLKTKKCQHPFGCTKRPSFGDAAEGIARFCMQHKARPHVNVKSRKCQEQGCAKQPTFGDKTDAVVRFCAVHRRDSDVDLVHGRCRSASCSKIASFGLPGEPPHFCFQHKDEHMDRTQVIGRARSRSEEQDRTLSSPSRSPLSGMLSGPPEMMLPHAMLSLKPAPGLAASGLHMQPQQQQQQPQQPQQQPQQQQPQQEQTGMDAVYAVGYGAADERRGERPAAQPAQQARTAQAQYLDRERSRSCGTELSSTFDGLPGPVFSRAVGLDGAGVESSGVHGRHSVHNLC